ncbi:permease for cytosine/purines, uracil, thiamine, allantoin-domain-containing protein [Xylogone sp. PMI_703]|nr:permease for cytosine/purines, uracil, thiamine, allantoin-domain-containing protein [Xylogone sp. PMI_703]
MEARGITRVLTHEKNVPRPLHDYFHMFALWFSINLQAINIIIGILGPLVYGLGWVDCVCIVIFANALASCGPAYLATFGPESGNRTMIIGRYFMGYWPSRIAGVCNIIQQVGFGTIGCIITGQMITAVNGGGLSLVVGCVIAAICIGLIATLGIEYLNKIERFGYMPQAAAIFVLIGSAGKNFDTSAVSVGDAGTINANRCSFFALVFASIIGFSAVSADFYVYYPKTYPKWMTFASTWSGIWVALIFSNLIGVGIATGVPNVPEWNDAYNISSGALFYACYDGLGGFGGFCVVILALGSITNNAPCSYSTALTIQALGRYPRKVPRWFWCVLITVVELVLSVAGRNKLYTVFENFLPMMAYWVCPWLIIVLEEHLIFHKLMGKSFDWSIYENKRRLPIGLAALLSFLIGFSGAIVGMYQIWYTGPIALKIGGLYGGDIGEWLAIGFAGVVFPPLRWLELRRFGR